MKNIIIVLFAAVLLSHTACAQKISADQIPASVISSFKTRFPGVTDVRWEKELSEYEANFKMNGNEISANFDANGKWLETEIEIKVSELPVAVQSAIHTYFSGYEIEEASKVESLRHGNCYEAEIEKGEETLDVLFSADGKLISQTKAEE